MFVIVVFFGHVQLLRFVIVKNFQSCFYPKFGHVNSLVSWLPSLHSYYKFNVTDTHLFRSFYMIPVKYSVSLLKLNTQCCVKMDFHNLGSVLNKRKWSK